MKRIIKTVAALFCQAAAVLLVGSLPVNADEPAPDPDPVPIDEAHFPDPVFRKYIYDTFDRDKDEKISIERNEYGNVKENEFQYIRNIHCENMGVTSLKGIEYFSDSIIGIWCRDNPGLTSIDLSEMVNVTGIWCSDCGLTELDTSACKDMEWIYCYHCDLRSLDFTQNDKMAYIECSDNPNLGKLDVTKNPALEHLFCANDGLTEIDLTHNPRLTNLSIKNNNLKSLDVTQNKMMKRLDCWYNRELGNIDVSGMRDLNYLVVAYTNMTEIDVTHNPDLLELSACNLGPSPKYDNLKELDLSKNPKLAYLAIECNTKLKKLDLSNNPQLYYLLAYGLHGLEDKTLDLSNNYRLCKAFNEGKYVVEPEKFGYSVYFKELYYGGSGDPLDEMTYVVGVHDDVKVNAKFNGTKVPDSVLNINDGHSDTDKFVTRYGAIQSLYELAGKPAVSGSPRFTDISADNPYRDAIKWGEDHDICFGYPVLCDDIFNGSQPVSRQDWALMAHRFARTLKLGDAFDYGRTDFYTDFNAVDFYAWGAYTWSMQFHVNYYEKDAELCRPHGRITIAEFKQDLHNLCNLDEAASYAQRMSEGGSPKSLPELKTTPYENITYVDPKEDPKSAGTPINVNEAKPRIEVPEEQPEENPEEKPEEKPEEQPEEIPVDAPIVDPEEEVPVEIPEEKPEPVPGVDIPKEASINAVGWGDVKEADRVELLAKLEKEGKKIEDVMKGIWVAGVPSEVPAIGHAWTFEEDPFGTAAYHLNVYDGNVLLKKGVDYTVKYKKNKTNGAASITIKGKGKYTSSSVIGFVITAMPSGNASGVKLVNGDMAAIPDMAYTGREASLNGLVKVTSGGKVLNGIALDQYFKLSEAERSGYDYNYVLIKGVSAGKATVVVNGVNGYSGTIKKSFKINKIDLSNGGAGHKISVKSPEKAVFVNGGAKPSVVVTVDDIALVEGRDYTLKYTNNKTAGAVATITVKGKGNYTGSIPVTFTVERSDLKKLTILANDVEWKDKAFNCKTKLTILDSNGKKLPAGKGYSKNLIYTYAKATEVKSATGAMVQRAAGARVEAGDVIPVNTSLRLTVYGAPGSAYEGTAATVTFKVIAPGRDISKAKVSVSGEKIYNGNEIKLSKNDIQLRLGGAIPEYSVLKNTYRNNNGKGNAAVVIKGTGEYGGYKTVKFKIKAKPLTIQ